MKNYDFDIIFFQKILNMNYNNYLYIINDYNSLI